MNNINNTFKTGFSSMAFYCNNANENKNDAGFSLYQLGEYELLQKCKIERILDLNLPITRSNLDPIADSYFKFRIDVSHIGEELRNKVALLLQKEYGNENVAANMISVSNHSSFHFEKCMYTTITPVYEEKIEFIVTVPIETITNEKLNNLRLKYTDLGMLNEIDTTVSNSDYFNNIGSLANDFYSEMLMNKRVSDPKYELRLKYGDLDLDIFENLNNNEYLFSLRHVNLEYPISLRIRYGDLAIPFLPFSPFSDFQECIVEFIIPVPVLDFWDKHYYHKRPDRLQKIEEIVMATDINDIENIFMFNLMLGTAFDSELKSCDNGSDTVILGKY